MPSDMQEMAESSDRHFVACADRRSKNRTAQDELQCSLGRVMDISPTGMRITCRRVPKEKWVKFDLNTTVDPIPVQARVVWAKRLGFRKHEIGLHFVDPSPELASFIRCCSMVDGKVRWNLEYRSPR